MKLTTSAALTREVSSLRRRLRTEARRKSGPARESGRLARAGLTELLTDPLRPGLAHQAACNVLMFRLAR